MNSEKMEKLLSRLEVFGAILWSIFIVVAVFLLVSDFIQKSKIVEKLFL